MSNVENLILEHLKRFQTGQDRIERRLEEIVSRMGTLELSVAAMRRDSALQEEASALISVRIDRMSDRVERIERRLELQDSLT